MINRLARLPIYGSADDNRDKPPAAPIRLEDGRLRCPGDHCRGILNRHTPARCPHCLQALEPRGHVTTRDLRDAGVGKT